MKFHPAAEVFAMLGDSELKALADDIRENGQREPIIRWGDVIVDGRNRFRACALAGRDPMFEHREFKDDAEVAMFVLSMNVHRRHLNESQRGMAVAKLLPMFEHAAKDRTIEAGRLGGSSVAKGVANLPDPSRSRDDAAKIANVSPRLVQDAKKVQAKASPELVRAVETGKVAVSAAAKLVDKPDDVQRAVVAKIESGEAKKPLAALGQIRTEALAKSAASAPKVESANILVGDAIARLADVENAHLVIMDPPYGLENHRVWMGAKKDYADGEEYALGLLRNTCEILARSVCAKDAHLYVFSGYSHAFAFKQILREYFDVQDNPLIWSKSNHAVCDYSKWYPNAHEYIWFCKMRGSQRPIERCILDVLRYSAERATDHSAEKPTSLLQTLIEQSTVAGEHVLDPFCGSGSTGVAAIRVKRRFTGIEMDPHWADVSRGRIAA